MGNVALASLAQPLTGSEAKLSTFCGSLRDYLVNSIPRSQHPLSLLFFSLFSRPVPSKLPPLIFPPHATAPTSLGHRAKLYSSFRFTPFLSPPPSSKMARGNQRDRAREKNLKTQAGQVSLQPGEPPRHHPRLGSPNLDVRAPRRERKVALTTHVSIQKKGNNQSGSEMQRSRESAAEVMRQKQVAGMSCTHLPIIPLLALSLDRHNAHASTPLGIPVAGCY